MDFKFTKLTEDHYVAIKTVADRHKISHNGRGKKISDLKMGVTINNNFTTCILKRGKELFVGQAKLNTKDLVTECETIKSIKSIRDLVLRQTHVSNAFKDIIAQTITREIKRKNRLSVRIDPKPEIGEIVAFNRAVYQLLGIEEDNVRTTKRNVKSSNKSSKTRNEKVSITVSKSK